MKRDKDDAVYVPRAGDALLVIDMQRDYLPGGSRAVPDAARVVAPLNAWIERFATRGLPIIATRDWHPADHCSFESQGGRWPAHCVAGTAGAAFAPALRLPPQLVVVSKGSAADQQAPSAFSDTQLQGRLRAAGVGRLFVGGVATEHCVLRSVLEARSLGFDVVVLVDAIAAIDAKPGDVELALASMRDAGAHLVDSRKLWREVRSTES
jgi:nicotinamidase/pyrazinamidase